MNFTSDPIFIFVIFKG